MYLGLDMGGTHTDAVILNQHQVIAHAKVLTCYENPETSIIEVLQELFKATDIKPHMITRATFGSTLALNAILQQKHDAVGLILAAGPGADPYWSAIGEHIFLTSAKLDHRGTELAPLEKLQLQKHIQQWKNKNITSFACIAKFSVRNPQHEQLMEAAIQNVFTDTTKQLAISQGHKLSDSLNFPRRVTTAYWNSAIWRIHEKFSTSIEITLKKIGITAPAFLLKADGGTMSLWASKNRPIEAIHSGPSASIMGILALSPTQEDCFILDMGGTTTDIALLAQGQPVLAPSGLMIEGRSTLIRSLLSFSLPIGGDSCITLDHKRNETKVQVGPTRHGPAMAFGGSQPTLIDCLNIQKYAQVGNIDASYLGLKQLSEQYNMPIDTIAKKAIATMQNQISEAMDHILYVANNQPIHTLESLIKQSTIQPKKCIITGGPSKIIAPILQKHLTLSVSTPHKYTLVTNAIGAALAKPTASIDLFATTEKGFCIIPSLNVKYSIEKTYTLEQACKDASRYLYDYFVKTNTLSSPIVIDTISTQTFSVINAFGQSNKEFRISCQIRPSLEYTIY